MRAYMRARVRVLPVAWQGGIMGIRTIGTSKVGIYVITEYNIYCKRVDYIIFYHN